VPDGAPETHCGFIVDELIPNRALVLHSTLGGRLGIVLADLIMSREHLHGVNGPSRAVDPVSDSSVCCVNGGRQWKR
jgi:hypothetical protein